METVAQRIAAVRDRIAAAASVAGRSPEEIRLLAVTKRVDSARVAAAVAAGIHDLGENYVQEARAKIPEVIAPDAALRWHLIGHLQTNKAKYAVDLFSLIQSVDNLQLVQELGRQATKKGKVQAVLVEVNLSREPQRAGIDPSEALRLAEAVQETPGLSLQGLMGMAPMTGRAADARPYFAELRALFEKLPPESRQVLSMGMSGDYEVAIEEGATLIRIGTALFGSRGE